MKNPKILHRIYFDNMRPYRDPFLGFLETWKRELPDYRIMQWNASNLDLSANEWVKLAVAEQSPVFLSEYFRWWVLREHGGMYLDADCELLDGSKLSAVIDDVFASGEYDAATGVEDFANGHPTAQTVIAKQNSELVSFMLDLYENRLAPFWNWREERGLIGPQLMSLYFSNHGRRDTKGMFWRLQNPEVFGRVKVYTQDYFSPKFAIDGASLNFTQNTCVYHLFANLNMTFDDATREDLRNNPLSFHEYRALLSEKQAELNDAGGLETQLAEPVAEPPNGPRAAKPDDAAEIVGHITTTETQKQTSVGKFARRLIPRVLSSNRRGLRTLHRIYFGFDGKPDGLTGYLRTWQAELPNYEIKHWNAKNLPLDINAYTRELAKAKDHAFLTDYFRWWVLREHGGIYLDADVEVVSGKKFSALVDELDATSDYDAFIGIDERHGGWYTAHSMASKRHSDLANTMCQVYEEMGPIRAWRKKAFYLWAPQLTALHFYRAGHNLDGLGTSPNLVSPQVLAKVKIYPQEYFSPIAPLKADDGSLFSINALSDRTSLCHHFACSWHDDRSPYSGHAQSFQSKHNSLLQELVQAQIDGAELRSFGAGTLLRYPASHPAVRTGAGAKNDTGIAAIGQAGTLLYGPYLDLLPGNYIARIRFHPEMPFTGRAHCDVAANSGNLSVVSFELNTNQHSGRVVELRFSTAQKLVQAEIRIFCPAEFSATIIGVEFERV